jgi:tetratricopeptide (TPR) repeat protein
LLDRALALHRKGQLADAAALYRKILRRNPRHADALHLLGVIETQRRNLSAAVELFDRAIELNPQNATFFSNRGNALKDMKRLDEALTSFNHAIVIKPDYAEALNNRGVVLHEMKRSGEALASLVRALAIKPDYAEAHYNRGNALSALKRLDEALTSFNRALAIKPDYAQALYNRGIVLSDLRRLDEALASYVRALAIRPDHIEALNNRGVVLRELKRVDEAITSYDRAIAIEPDFADALYNRGLAQLLCGDYRRGFGGYEWRWKAKDFSSTPPEISAPKWQGEDIAGRSILVFSEQGLGDAIQFARFLPLLIERGAKVTFLCPAKIVRLLRPLSTKIVFGSSLTEQGTFDCQCALMSLPLWLGTDLGSIPSRMPYLEPEADLAAEWKQTIGKAGFKIGIAWQGKPGGKIDQGRSVPLCEFTSFARRPGVRLISLQKNYGVDQLMNLPAGVTVETLGDEFDGGPDAFIDTAAVMSGLDLIVTSDTSIAHLAGALGLPTWVALQHVPDWRWLLDRDDSPWYPTIRLFRQQTPGDWSTVFRNMTVELDAILSNNHR